MSYLVDLIFHVVVFLRKWYSKVLFKRYVKKFTEDVKTSAQKDLDAFMESFTTFSEFKKSVVGLTRKGFKGLNDPLGGLYDFSPEELWLFFARKGDDCDGWAELVAQGARKLKLSPEIWIIADPYAIFKSAHVITLIPYRNKWVLSSNYDFETHDTKEECFTRWLKSSGQPLLINHGFKDIIYSRFK
jgi:hypothetical protein